MGQSYSSTSDNDTHDHSSVVHTDATLKYPSFTSREQVLEYTNKQILHSYTEPELVSFAKRLNQKLIKQPLTDDEVCDLLYIPKNLINLRKLVINFIKTLRTFPLISDNKPTDVECITGFDLLKIITITSRERRIKYLPQLEGQWKKLYFFALSTTTEKEVKFSTNNEKIPKTTNLLHIIKTLDDTALKERCIPTQDLQQILAWLLTLSISCKSTNDIVNMMEITDNWDLYEQQMALSLLRSMNPSIIQNTKDHVITYRQFIDTIDTVAPYVFNPLKNLMEHLLFVTESLVEQASQHDELFKDSKVMSSALIAQLSTILPTELFTVNNLQKLYIGRESGFSMRSLQSKVFKWAAPTIFLIQGMKILDDEVYSKKNARYQKFLTEYPRLHDSEQTCKDPCILQRRKVLFAVYVDQPWKVTNKEYFGSGPHFKMIQLAPRQDIFKVSATVGDKLMYFNTMGGGIGIGSNQPNINSNTGKIRFSPGNVSLVIDNSLEFAVFRHLNINGSLNVSQLYGGDSDKLQDESFEIKFLVQDVEVWGCGDEKALEAQMKEWEWENREAERRQHINLKSMGEDRALLEMAGIVGQHQSGGSV